MAVAQNPPPVPDRSRRHVALGQEVASEAVGDLAGIDAIVLLFGRRDGPQHQRVRHFYGCGMRQQMVIDPPAEHRCFHRDGARLRKRSHPSVQLAPARADFAFLMHTTSRVLHAITDRLLRNWLRCNWHELESKLMSVPAQTQLHSLPALLITLIKNAVAIGFLREQDMIDDARDLMCSGRDGGGCTQFGSHTTEEITKIAFSAAKRVRT